MHNFGHIASGKLAGSAMDELLFTAARAVNIYHGDQSRVPSDVHIIRPLGRPLANLHSAARFYPLLSIASADLLVAIITSTISTSIFAGLFSFLPIPSIDGWVIWREAVRALRRQRAITT